MARVQFEHKGFIKEYYIDNKFIGSIHCNDDGRESGYNGRKKEILSQDIQLKNKKIKSGTEVTTIIYALCGKIIKNK